MSVALRPAVAADGPFLVEMLVEAANWRPDEPIDSAADVLRDPDLAHYVVDWQRPSDLGVVAEDVVAEAECRVGAAWLRYFPASDPGYGFVDTGTPELAMAVATGRRGEGIGGALLAALLEASRAVGIPAISLSVERDNYAHRLYEQVGFRTVRAFGGSTTMLFVAREPAR